MSWMVAPSDSVPFSLWRCLRCGISGSDGGEERRAQVEVAASQHVTETGHTVSVQHGTVKIFAPMNYERPPERDRVQLTADEEDEWTNLMRGTDS
jgi:hypothetical protein